MSDSAGYAITCPQCHKSLRVKAEWVGKRVRCPNPACGTPLTIPAPPTPKPVAPSPAPRKRWPWVLTAALLLLASGTGLGFSLRGFDLFKPKETTAERTSLESPNKSLEEQAQHLKNLGNQLLAEQTQRKSLEGQIEQLQKQLADFASKVNLPDEKLKLAEAAAQDLRESLAKAQRQLDELVAKNKSLEKLVADLGDKLDKADVELARAKIELGKNGDKPKTPFKEDELNARLLKSTVWIVILIPSKPPELVYDEGSGWVLDAERRLVVTNYHVVGKKEVRVLVPMYAQGKPVTERRPYVPLIAESKGIRGKVLAVDSGRDLALIQLDSLAPDMLALPIAAKGVTPGERVFNLGNPGGGELWKFIPSTALGIEPIKAVSKKGDLELLLDMRMVETDDANAMQGQSGSLLVNKSGEIVGVLQGASRKTPRTTLFIDRSELLSFLDANGILKASEKR